MIYIYIYSTACGSRYSWQSWRISAAPPSPTIHRATGLDVLLYSYI